jgi:hypothetical protein
MHQVVAANSALTEMGISGGATSRNDDGRNSVPKQIKTLVEPGPQHRRWVPRIFSCAKDNNRVSGSRFLERCCADDANAGGGQKNNNAHT